MPLVVQTATFADGPAIAHVSIEAFFDDPLQRSLWPGVSKDTFRKNRTLGWPNTYGNPSLCYKKVFDDDTGEVVSYSNWKFDFTDAGKAYCQVIGWPEDVTIDDSLEGEGINKEFAEDYFERVSAIRKQHLAERPQLVLNIVGTIPAHRGRGAAGTQLAWGVEVADKLGLPCWVDASPVAVSLYEKFGFEAKGTVTMDLLESCGGGRITYTCMLREPRDVDNTE